MTRKVARGAKLPVKGLIPWHTICNVTEHLRLSCGNKLPLLEVNGISSRPVCFGPIPTKRPEKSLHLVCI